MSSGACELASGKGAKETGLQFLFRGASIVDRWGEAISTLTKFKDKTVLLFYGASWAESSKQFSTLLSKFYDIVMDTGEDALVVIFISNDKSQEAQLSFFNDSCIHKDWLMVERGPHLDEIMTTIDVERIPGLSVVGQEGTSVVEKAPEEIFEMFLEGNKLRNENDVKQRVLEKWAAWKKLAGDWDAPSGYTCGGSSGVASSSSAAQAVIIRAAQKLLKVPLQPGAKWWSRVLRRRWLPKEESRCSSSLLTASSLQMTQSSPHQTWRNSSKIASR